MKLTLIRPPVVHLKGDFYGSIPGIPTGLAHLAAVVRMHGHDVDIIDCYGSDPHNFFDLDGNYRVRGLEPHRAAALLPSETEIVGLSVHCTTEQVIAEPIIAALREKTPELKIIVGGYHPTFVPEEFLGMGADYVVLGAGEARLPQLLDVLAGKGSLEDIEGIATRDFNRPRETYLDTVDGYPPPAIDLLPLENYWELGYGHGPVRERYMNVITSRGCPFNCGFCQAPLMSGRRWIARTPDDVIRELIHYNDTWGIRDFHVQDENFALDRDRAAQFCGKIMEINRRFTFCLPSGINAMTMDEELVTLMAQAGFRYLSVSPETGSPRVLELMDKRMDLDHLAHVVGWSHANGIRTNACFMLGYPGETDEDRVLTKRYVNRLVHMGIDEIIIPIMTPFPGTPSMKSFEVRKHEELCFSPVWRADYTRLSGIRFRIYCSFLLRKLLKRPGSIFRQILNVITRRHATKGEMTITRILRDNYDWYIRRPFGHIFAGKPR